MAAASLVVCLAVRFALAQESSEEQPKIPRPQAQDDLVRDVEDDRPATAEELLDALRRARPSQEVIPPAGAADFPPTSDSRKLLPEGAAVVDRKGRLGQEGEWWLFIADPPTGEPALKLLPNLSLEVMVRMTQGSNQVMRFVVAGEVTVFRNENYLLVRLFRRAAPHVNELASPTEDAAQNLGRGIDATQRDSEVGRGIDPTHGVRQPPRGPVRDTEAHDLEQPHNGAPGPAPATSPSAEDVLSALQQQKPPEPVMPVEALPGPAAADRSAEETPSSDVTTAHRYLLPEGSTIVHRAGRLIPEGRRCRFVFESDHREFPEPPMKVLPCQSLERMLAAWEENPHGLLFQVSGEVTLFEGENYLLPHVAYRQITTGNVRK